MMKLFEQIHCDIVEFCVAEIVRQHVPRNRQHFAVVGMLRAWNLASGQTTLTLDFIKQLGKLVEPVNSGGLRRCTVVVGSHFPPGPEDVPTRINRLITIFNEAGSTMTAEEFYKEFQTIHPFEDGNGRVGKVLYNFIKGTLDNPQMPPNFWDCANP